MEKERLQKAGDFILDGVLIVGSSGARINIIDQVQELNIYESIDTPYISGNLLIADSSGVAEILPILGQERLLFKLRTPGHSDSINFNNYHAIIYNVEKRFSTSDREHILVLNWTTLEHLKNLRTKISASFKGTISEIVQKIIKSDNYLGSKKPLSIEPTKNIRKFVIPNLTPFQAINLIKSEAVSGEEQSPHYVFFETPDGLYFRSFDSLLGQRRDLSIKHKNTYRSQPPEQNNAEANLATILDWQVDDNSNAFLNTRLGMYGSTLFYHDIFNKNIQKFEYNYMKDKFNRRNSMEQGVKTSGALVSQTILEDKKTISEFPDSKIFVHPTASDNLHTEGTDNNAEEWLQESMSRELERTYFTLKIETYGDTNIMCGDLINVVIPSNRPLQPPVTKASIDPILSGRYLITSLHHAVHPTEQMHNMVLTITKDSLDVEPSVVETKYKEEPT
ncbi:MAG TPA: hypothetical protein EYG07_00800, partial [Alphaproteobacteria bacterium]|nr:hypothetical protein [Alphaproteobacteria bacterium]